MDSFTTQNLTPVQPTSEEVTVSDDGYATFTYTFDEQNISTIETTTNLQQADGAHEVSLYATDEGNKYPHLLGSDSITFSTDPSQFFQIYPSGKVTSIQFVIDLAKSDEGVVFGSEQDAERNQNSASLQNERKQGKVVSQDLLLDVDDLHFQLNLTFRAHLIFLRSGLPLLPYSSYLSLLFVLRRVFFIPSLMKINDLLLV